MKIICVDDDPSDLRDVVSMCERLTQRPQVEGFENGKEALRYLQDNRADIGILDIHMPEMDGLRLTARIKELCPRMAIIFLTGDEHCAIEAFRLRVSGYLLKPASREALQEEVDYIIRDRPPERVLGRVTVQTFGEFNVYVDGKTVEFSRSKAKEVLAYLVDRQGGYMTRAMIFSALWGDERNYDRPMQKYLDVILSSMKETLEAYGIGGIVERSKGQFRVCPEKFSCDLYRFFDGDISSVDAYHGEYMSSYSWASLAEAYMDRIGGVR